MKPFYNFFYAITSLLVGLISIAIGLIKDFSVIIIIGLLIYLIIKL